MRDWQNFCFVEVFQLSVVEGWCSGKEGFIEGQLKSDLFLIASVKILEGKGRI